MQFKSAKSNERNAFQEQMQTNKRLNERWNKRSRNDNEFFLRKKRNIDRKYLFFPLLCFSIIYVLRFATEFDTPIRLLAVTKNATIQCIKS